MKNLVQARGPNKATHIEEAYTKKVAEMKQIIARFGGPRELDIAPGPAATVNNPAMTPGAIAARDEKFLATIPAEDRQIFLDARAGKPVNADIKGTRELAARLPAPDELLGTSPVAANPVTSFQTSQGSVYTYDSDGRVHRQKSTVGSSMEASSSSFDRTVFLPETDIESARLGLERGLKPTESGQLRGLDYDSNKMNSKLFMDLRFRGRKSYDEAFTAAGGTITERLITPSTEPQLGYNPLEYNIGDQKFHPGNVVTQISYKDGSTKQIELGTKSAETVSGTAKTKGADLYELGKKLHPQFEKDMPASLKTAFDEGRIKTLFRTSSMAIAGDMGIGRLKGGAIEGGDSLSLYAVDEDGRIARLGKGGMGWTGDPRMTGTTEKTTDATIFAEDVRYANPYVGGKSGNKDMLAAKDSMSKTPQVGFNPVEFDSKGGVHTGSFITDIYHSTGEAEFSDKITTGPRRRYFKNT